MGLCIIFTHYGLAMNEFGIIKKYFLPLTQGRREALGLKDDAAVFSIPKKHEVVVTSDISNAGIHFLENEKPENIAHKCLRVNLSDLAAMGADPYAYQLSIAFPGKPSETWLRAFTGAMLKDQKKFGIFCSGGDTTRTNGPLSIAITAFGTVPKGKAVKRRGARPADALVITGPVGDAFVGLKMLQNKIKNVKAESCVRAYRTPTPRNAIARLVRQHASAAIDISDGLIADAAHIANASDCALHIDLEKIEFSKVAGNLIKKGIVTKQQLLSGGDDYELALAIPQKSLSVFLKKLRTAGLKPQVIGVFQKGRPGVSIFEKHRKIHFGKSGWQHF